MGKKADKAAGMLEEKTGIATRLKASGKGTVIVLSMVLVFLAVTYAVVLNAIRPDTPGREITIDEVVDMISEKSISEMTLLSEDHRLVGTDEQGPWWTALGPFDTLSQRLLSDAISGGITTRIDGQSGKNLLKLATQFVLPAATGAVMLALFFSMRQRGGGGANEYATLGRVRATRFGGEKDPSRVTFADVAGADEAIQELKEVRDFLKHPEMFERIGAKAPRGILLLGPPGTGKTLLAKAVAGEAGVPFFSASGAAFAGMLVGVGPERVRDLFKKATEAAPSIVFVDEIDAMGRARGGGTDNPEGESTLNELLVQLDGFDASKRIVLMAATNRADILDPALLRKGRFDRQIVIDVPDYKGRLAIFKVHARGKPFGSDVDLERFARRTVGMSGAEIAAIVNEAATLAARKGYTRISSKEISEGIERVMAGPEMHTRILGPEEKQRIAYHEAGHAVVGWALQSTATVDKVSVVSRGHSLGMTWSLPVEDRRVQTRSQIEEELSAVLAGRAAELVVYQDPSGASHADLVRATQLARQMVYELGMSEALGPMTLRMVDNVQIGSHSDELTRAADAEVRQVLEEAHQRAGVV
ncbi:MAG TPA: AAA family ATPase, partial [Acidimicrobiales bacterium]|nr:AAA family ATPase [Acidimicrobiales bacterium]